MDFLKNLLVFADSRAGNSFTSYITAKVVLYICWRRWLDPLGSFFFANFFGFVVLFSRVPIGFYSSSNTFSWFPSSGPWQHPVVHQKCSYSLSWHVDLFGIVLPNCIWDCLFSLCTHFAFRSNSWACWAILLVLNFQNFAILQC